MNNGTGMYAFKKVIDLFREVPNATVCGQIYLWGTVIECGQQDTVRRWTCGCPDAVDLSMMIPDLDRTSRVTRLLCPRHNHTVTHQEVAQVNLVKGWRAQYAYPKHLLVTDEAHVKLLTEKWKVPVEHGSINGVMQKILQERNIDHRDVRGGYY
jgi:hypothetical protein